MDGWQAVGSAVGFNPRGAVGVEEPRTVWGARCRRARGQGRQREPRVPRRKGVPGRAWGASS